MHYSKEIVSYLQSNNILASKLDHALIGVRNAVTTQIDMIGAGAQRALYYSSCFTQDYQDVCRQHKTEDIRFLRGVEHLLGHGNLAYDMLKLYFEGIFRHKTNDQLEYIKKGLIAVNVHIAASHLTIAGMVLAAATAVAVGLNLSLNMSALIGGKTAGLVRIAGIYGVVQKAADSARRLHYTAPGYFSALYTQELEMMFFLIEPLFDRAQAFNKSTSDKDIINIIRNMIG